MTDNTNLAELAETLSAIANGARFEAQFDSGEWFNPNESALWYVRHGFAIRIKPKHIRQELALELLEAAREMTIHWDDCDKTNSEVCRARALCKAIQNIDEDQ